MLEQADLHKKLAMSNITTHTHTLLENHTTDVHDYK